MLANLLTKNSTQSGVSFSHAFEMLIFNILALCRLKLNVRLRFGTTLRAPCSGALDAL